MSRSLITNISPLPSNIPRDAAVAQLHDHASMIQANPLVIKFESTTAPAEASGDEAEFGTWYEITDKINYLPGISGQVSYKACFYNLPNGLQTHTFAPAGLELRGKWLVCGSMPGEPREPLELGLDAPREGLYIREEVDMRCNVLLSSFVKKNLKKSHAQVMTSLISRAENALTKGRDSNNTTTGGRETSPAKPPNFSQRDTRPPSAGITEPTARPNDSLNDRLQPSSMSIPSRSVPIPQRRPLPLHCNCTGSFHLRTCFYFHPDDRGDTDVFAAPGVSTLQHPRRHTFSTPSVASISPISSRSSSPERRDPCVPELYGSVRSDQCLCTGALHTRGCPGYPGLRTPRAVASSYSHHTTTTSSRSPHYTSTSSISATPSAPELRVSALPRPRSAQMLSTVPSSANNDVRYLGGNTKPPVPSSSPEDLRPTHNFSYSSPAFDGFPHAWG